MNEEGALFENSVAAPRRFNLSELPWWLFTIVVTLIVSSLLILFHPGAGNFRDSAAFVAAGLSMTAFVSITSYVAAIIIGLLVGLGRISNNLILRNIATLYVEIIRGIPMLVLIFFLALVVVPTSIELLVDLGRWAVERGFMLAQPLAAIDIQAVPMVGRAIVALAITYGAFLAEIFRAGIQSIGRGQMEAARSLGMTYGQAMRYVILPQAIRNVLPALGNDFVAMVKDSSLVSVLAVRDITQIARLYAGRTFQFRETYTVLAMMYLTMTLILSRLVAEIERRMNRDRA